MSISTFEIAARRSDDPSCWSYSRSPAAKTLLVRLDPDEPDRLDPIDRLEDVSDARKRPPPHHRRRPARSERVESVSRRQRPLPLQVGDVYLILVPDDVNAILAGIGKLADGMRNANAGQDMRPGAEKALGTYLDELAALQQALTAPASSLADPPFEVTRDRARLLRLVLADITGYQRGDLTPGLRELRRLLSTR